VWLGALLESIDSGSISASEAAFFRVAVNLNKLATAVLAHDAVNHGIEVLGGNGAIESFSIMPRLLRDNVVYENWEGSHNVLRAQVLRDCSRMGVHAGFFDVLASRLGEDAVAADRAEMDAVMGLEPELASLRFRPLAMRMAVHVMRASLAGVPELSAQQELLGRHLKAPTLDANRLELIESLQR